MSLPLSSVGRARILLSLALLSGPVVAQTATYVFSTVAGSAGQSGFVEGSGTSARFNLPVALAADALGNLYVADSLNHVIRKISPAGVVSTLAGVGGVPGVLDGVGTAARFNQPSGIAIDAVGTLYVSEESNHTVRKVTAAGVVTTLAGTPGSPGAEDGPGASARFFSPQQLAVDGLGNVYVADSGNHTIRKISPTGVVSTLAGSAGLPGSADGVGAAARFFRVAAVAVNANGDVFAADQGNHTIRRITPAGEVFTVAGAAGASGSTDGQGTAARFLNPWAIAVDLGGSLYVTEQINNTVRRITSSGLVSTIGGTPGISGWADGVAGNARFIWPRGLAVLADGRIFLADQFNHLIRKGEVSTVFITSEPKGTVLGIGGGATLSVVASSSLPLSYQWRRNGLDLPGATLASLAIVNAQLHQTGDYSVRVSNSQGSVVSGVARLSVIPRVGSYSARLQLEEEGALGTFVIEGPVAKKVLLRAVGPGLAPFGLSGLPDPRLEVFDRQGVMVAMNDDWGTAADPAAISATTAAVGAFALSPNSKDAAMVLTLPAGAYSVRARPSSGPGGVGYLELYDADLSTGPVSAVPYVGVRGRLAAGGGVVVGGMGPLNRGQRNYLIRAIGPTLGLPGALANPAIQVVRSGALVGQNDDWDANPTEAAAAVSSAIRVGAFALPSAARDAALALAGNLHAAPCTVQVGSGDAAGGVILLELHDVDATRPDAFAPFLPSPPVATTVTAGASTTLRVLAHGSAPLSYQWRREGVPIAGATASTYSLAAADLAAGGAYTVVVTNGQGSATSLPALLTVQGSSGATSGTHALIGSAAYQAGGTVTVQNTLNYEGSPTGLGWSVILPAGWTFVSDAGSAADARPLAGDTGTVEWAWATAPAGALTFTYTIRAPLGASGVQQLSAAAIVRFSGALNRFAVSPQPLSVPQQTSHSADTDANYRIGLLELTRVIELYNTRNGATRTGAYAVAAGGTEDGFAIDAGRAPAAVVALARHHSADSNRDGKIALLELTRVIELYNYRNGSTRTGQYRVQEGTEDGFAPGS